MFRVIGGGASDRIRVLPSDPPKPKVTLAVADAAIRDRLSRALGDAEVEVEHVQGEDAWRRLAGGGSDVVVVRRSQLASPKARQLLEEMSREQDGPAVVVLGDAADPVERTRLLAAGVETVLPESAPAVEVGEVVEAVAEARAAGAATGPEHRGSGVEPRLADFRTRAPRMRDFLRLVRKVVDSDTSLLITGETGVGKEHLARAIHAESPRAEGPFVGVNCAALPEQLLESELFGHRAGAFTGATKDRKGRFELAQGGTIFLDEIGEMPKMLQVKLLTVLQRFEVRPLGAEEPVPVDVRVMAASNRDLDRDVEEGRFREDLFFRLNVVPLRIPPLRERREDLPDLIGRFLRHFRGEMEREGAMAIEEHALDLLLAYDWPGNVRELVNVVERAVLLCTGDRITLAQLPPEVRGEAAAPADGGDGDGLPLPEDWDERPLAEVRAAVLTRFERAYLERLLARTRGRVGETAKLAGIAPRSLYEKMKRHGLRKEDFRG